MRRSRLGQMKYVLPKHIKIRTEPLNKFIENHSRGVEYFLFVLHAVDSADNMRRIARNALVNTGAREPSENFNEDHYSKDLRKFSKYNQMLLVNNTIQYFGVYFSEISSAIYHEKLDMLRSSEVMRHSDIMSLPSKEDIVEYIIDQKVSNISHMGLDKIIEHSNKTFGIN